MSHPVRRTALGASYNATVIVGIIPEHDPFEECRGFAHELAAALGQVSAGDVQVVLADSVNRTSGEPPGVVHLVATDFASLRQLALRAMPAGGYPALLGTILHLRPPEDMQHLPGPPPRIRYLLLAEDEAGTMQAWGIHPTRVETVPCPVPEVTLTKHERVASGRLVTVLAPGRSDVELVRQAVLALAELPRDVSILVCTDGSADVVGLSDRCEAWAQDVRAAERLVVQETVSEAELDSAIAAADAVLVTVERCAGMWHSLRSLAHGKPTASPDLPVFRDAMLRGAGIRLVRPGVPGHVPACLRAILGNSVGMAEMRDRAIAYASTHSMPSVARAIARLYVRLSQ